MARVDNVEAAVAVHDDFTGFAGRGDRSSQFRSVQDFSMVGGHSVRWRSASRERQDRHSDVRIAALSYRHLRRRPWNSKKSARDAIIGR